MLLVILGAGASYDSAPYHMLDKYPVADFPWRPPLADHLFERPAFYEVLARHPYVKAIVPQLTGVKQTPLERILDRLQFEGRTYPARRAQLVDTRLYLRDLLIRCRREWTDFTQGITNYFSLLDQLQEWGFKSGQSICIVTFNYDLLLEDALPTVGVNTSTLDGYIAHPGWKIIKPHGSVNWARNVQNVVDPDTEAGLIAAASGSIALGEDIVWRDKAVGRCRREPFRWRSTKISNARSAISGRSKIAFAKQPSC